MRKYFQKKRFSEKDFFGFPFSSGKRLLMHGCKISFNYQNLSRETPQTKEDFILFSFLFLLKIGLLNILFLLVLDKNFQKLWLLHGNIIGLGWKFLAVQNHQKDFVIILFTFLFTQISFLNFQFFP